MGTPARITRLINTSKEWWNIIHTTGTDLCIQTVDEGFVVSGSDDAVQATRALMEAIRGLYVKHNDEGRKAMSDAMKRYHARKRAEKLSNYLEAGGIIPSTTDAQ